MSEPSVLRQGQLGQGRAAIPAHVVDAPWYLLLQLVQGEKMLLLCQAVRKGGMDTSHRQLLILACCQTAHLGQECPCLAQGKGLPTAALCHMDNVTSRARQAGAPWPAGRTDL